MTPFINDGEKPSIQLMAFLSHRYKSPGVNRFFYDIFTDESAEVQFEVDVGSTAVNLTRLERMIRDSDAFIGVYAYSGDPNKDASVAELRNASQYFRLESELAIRSRKPALVFFDERYARLFEFPRSIRAESFDHREVTEGGSSKRARFRNLFGDFCNEVRAAIEQSASRPTENKSPEIGVLVPQTGPARDRYEENEIECIRGVLSAFEFQNVTVLTWPPSLSLAYLTNIERFDWVIVDIGETTMSTGIPGYLHGRLIPTVRLLKGASSFQAVRNRRSIKAFFGGVEVGYSEDIIVWEDTTTLERELTSRISVLTSPRRRISTADQAYDYFEEAALQKEAVFLSYSGKDHQLAKSISDGLKRNFQQVFDYRDGESIVPGRPWLREIFDKLAGSTLGILLLTDDYLKSGNCTHEAETMVARRDSHEMVVIPVLAVSKHLELPVWLQSLQFLDAGDDPNTDETVARIIKVFDKARS